MCPDKKEWLSFTKSIPYKLAETARISELLGKIITKIMLRM